RDEPGIENCVSNRCLESAPFVWIHQNEPLVGPQAGQDTGSATTMRTHNVRTTLNANNNLSGFDRLHQRVRGLESRSACRASGLTIDMQAGDGEESGVLGALADRC